MIEQGASTQVNYHLSRARAERDIAYRSGEGVAGDVHMRLSALHLDRALTLQAVQQRPIGNVQPFKQPSAAVESAAALPLLEIPSAR